ncbi:MAG: DPP IV N-terminal domain-containing protein [Prevotella sp.]|nr:DPP IV N-terminal domain-containing protein [Prevotella sp.]
MRKFFLLIAMMMVTTTIMAKEKLDIKSITDGTFAAKRMSGMIPIEGTDQYARIENEGTTIKTYSFKTGKETGTLFDANHTQGETVKSIDGYIMSPDGKKMLIQTNTKSIYRRSYTADFYIYTIQSRKLAKLSDGGPQQVPTWSPDGTMVAFVRDNNIFLVKLLYDNSESQVTKDGKFNEIINGIPDWVNEEEFSFNKSLCFNADASMICWIKYDETAVKEYSLQMFQGMNPAKEEYAVYPGEYSYKYPKAGEDNSKVTAWSFDIKSKQVRQLDVPVDADGYMPRILPTSEADKILVYSMNRHQDRLHIYSVNPRSTVSQLLIKESVSKYVKEDVMSSTIIGKSHILMPSDRDGNMHLYVYTMNGTMERKIGDGKYDITNVYGYDEATGDVYYQAAALNAHDRQVYVNHNNGKTVRLTQHEGWNQAIFSGDYKYFINTWSDKDHPYI